MSQTYALMNSSQKQTARCRRDWDFSTDRSISDPWPCWMQMHRRLEGRAYRMRRWSDGNRKIGKGVSTIKAILQLSWDYHAWWGTQVKHRDRNANIFFHFLNIVCLVFIKSSWEDQTYQNLKQCSLAIGQTRSPTTKFCRWDFRWCWAWEDSRPVDSNN